MKTNNYNVIARAVMVLALGASMAGCAPIVARMGPTAGAVLNSRGSELLSGIVVVDLDRSVTEKVLAAEVRGDFARDLGSALPVGSVVQPGDVLEVSIWEAPPAALFGGSGSSSLSGRDGQLSTTSAFPELLVGLSGSVFVPFAGNVPVAGRTPLQIEADITRRLSRKAHLPQVIVRVVRNATANATVVGDVANSTRMPLTPKGETLLDALAQAGGTRQPTAVTTIQVTRGSRVVSMPMDTVIREPSQNIVLAPGDVVTAVFQPYTFSALGASVRNQEVPFEGGGISLSQALSRVGGLQDQRADAKGVFLFRWEKADKLGLTPTGPVDPLGRIPVVYRADMRDPATLFLAQKFPVRDKDILYISTASISELQQFVNIIVSTILPITVLSNSLGTTQR